MDQIVKDIDARIVALRGEATRLEAAREALLAPPWRAVTPAPSRARRARISASAAPAPVRNGSGATQARVLDALAGADEPLTARAVAGLTGLGRPSVSTTLSKLARAGAIAKADRGYALKD